MHPAWVTSSPRDVLPVTGINFADSKELAGHLPYIDYTDKRRNVGKFCSLSG